ncbi:MAG: copper homeostasis protein CutC [Gemmatimonadaceae bacterium]
MALVESAVDTLESALRAERAGARRIELCASLNDGGTTPSAGLIEIVTERCRLPIFVMIRPRGGGFVYTAAERDVMLRDVEIARSLGAHGVVFGALADNGKIDGTRTRQLVRVAEDLPVTFHRAFDQVTNSRDALAELIDLGVARVLTAGGANTALEGASRIGALVDQAEGRLRVMAGGGVRESNVQEIISRTGVDEVHARITSVSSGGEGGHGSVKFRTQMPDNEGDWDELDESRMRDLVTQAG